MQRARPRIRGDFGVLGQVSAVWTKGSLLWYDLVLAPGVARLKKT